MKYTKRQKKAIYNDLIDLIFPIVAIYILTHLEKFKSINITQLIIIGVVIIAIYVGYQKTLAFTHLRVYTTNIKYIFITRFYWTERFFALSFFSCENILKTIFNLFSPGLGETGRRDVPNDKDISISNNEGSAGGL